MMALMERAHEHPHTTLPEHKLIQRLQTGDTEAFETLFRQYVAQVLRQATHLLGNPAEAEEVVQEVFLTVYEKAHTFRGEAAFRTWLYRLTMNAARSRLRRRRRSKEVTVADYLPRFLPDGHYTIWPGVDWSADLETCLAKTQLRHLLRETINLLAPLDRAVLVLSDLEELAHKDISATLGLTIPAVKARLHRARLFLRGRLAVTLGHTPT